MQVEVIECFDIMHLINDEISLVGHHLASRDIQNAMSLVYTSLISKNKTLGDHVLTW